MKFSIFNFQFSSEGFTLLEIIIAIFVITVGIVGAYAVVTKVLSLNYINANRLTASYLAQEGIEIVRNVRDANWLKGAAFDNGLNDGDWLVQYNRPELLPFAVEPLKIDTQGFYNYDSGNSSNFKRKISIEHLGIEEITVKAMITWPGKGSPFELQGNLYNWK